MFNCSKTTSVKRIRTICIKILFHELQGGFIEQPPIVHRPKKVEVRVGVLVHPGVGDQVGQPPRQVLLILRNHQPVVLAPEKCDRCCYGFVEVFRRRSAVPPGDICFSRSPVRTGPFWSENIIGVGMTKYGHVEFSHSDDENSDGDDNDKYL